MNRSPTRAPLNLHWLWCDAHGWTLDSVTVTLCLTGGEEAMPIE